MPEEPTKHEEEDDDEDLFGQDDEEENNSKSNGKEGENQSKEESEEDMFRQDDDEEKKDVSIQSELKHSSEDRKRPGGEISTPTDKKPKIFEVDKSPTEISTAPSPVLSPVPRKSPAKITSPTQQIPRKSTTPTKPDSKSSPSPKKGTLSVAAKLGLPEGVIIPESVSITLLEGRILDTLKELPANLISDALQEYDDAVKQQKHIRSHGAYLFGVLKRYLSVHQSAGGSMGQELTPLVRERLDKLVRDGFCTRDEMNEKVKSKIRMLSEKDALFAIEEFAGVDRASIRNFGSYFMGILNRYMRGDRSSKDRRGNRHQDNYGMKNDRRYQRGRSPDRDYRNRRGYGGNEERFDYRRERSRDDSHRKHNDRSNYDTHRRHYPQHQQNHYGPPSASVPPPPPPRPPLFNQQQQQPGVFLRQTQHNYVPNQGFKPGNASSLNQFNAQPPVHGQPHTRAMPNNGYPPPSYNPGTQGGYTPVNPMNSRPNLQVGSPSNGFSPATVQPPAIQNPTMPSWQLPQVAPQQQHHGQIPGPDIMGIAAKAAQALAANQSILQPNVPVQHQQNPAQNFPGQQPAYSTGIQHEQQQPNHQQIPQPAQQSHSYQSSLRRGGSRTIAKMHELPIAVQFAVQNLQAIGHIEGPLDEGILGMIKDLPEQLALAAMSRFSSLDKSTMRNTTAYLAGVLRRELEKIQRR